MQLKYNPRHINGIQHVQNICPTFLDKITGKLNEVEGLTDL